MTATRDGLLVGYQGTEGAYSELAAKRHFADAAVRCVGFHSFSEMLGALKPGALDFAVLPIENSIAGSINESYDLLAKMGLFLVGDSVLLGQSTLAVAIGGTRTAERLAARLCA